MNKMNEWKLVGILQENFFSGYAKFEGVELIERCFTKNGPGEDEERQYRCPNAGCPQIVLAERPFGSNEFCIRQIGNHNCQGNPEQQPPRLIDENFLPIFAQLDSVELRERSFKLNKGGGEDEKHKFRCSREGCPRMLVAKRAAGTTDFHIQQKGEHNCLKNPEEQHRCGISPIAEGMPDNLPYGNGEQMELNNGQEGGNLDEMEEKDEAENIIADKTIERRSIPRNHQKKRSSPCPHCGKRFSTESYLRKHLKLHTRIGLHRCNVCNKESLYPSDLRKHMAIHGNNKPFKCNICGKSFKDPSVRNRHLKKIH